MNTKAPIDTAVALLAAMAHPLRLRVLVTLSHAGPASVGVLQAQLEVEQSQLSHQLRVLRDARLVRGERAGKKVIYALADSHVERLVEDTLAHAAGICADEVGS